MSMKMGGGYGCFILNVFELERGWGKRDCFKYFDVVERRGGGVRLERAGFC